MTWVHHHRTNTELRPASTRKRDFNKISQVKMSKSWRILMPKLNKTEKYLLLIQTICKAPMLKPTEAKVIELFENPSGAIFYRDMAELCSDSGTRKALLQKIKDSEGNIFYQLNQCDWYAYLEGSLELQFVLKAYKDMGHLFPHFEIEGMKPNVKDLNRKYSRYK